MATTYTYHGHQIHITQLPSGKQQVKIYFPKEAGRAIVDTDLGDTEQARRVAVRIIDIWTARKEQQLCQ